MTHYIDKSAVVAEIEKLISNGKFKCQQSQENNDQESYIAWSEHIATCGKILSFLNTLKVKEVDSMIHTIIAECCDWLAMNTNLSHDEIEGCRNLMLTVKDEQLKAQKGTI